MGWLFIDLPNYKVMVTFTVERETVMLNQYFYGVVYNLCWRKKMKKSHNLHDRALFSFNVLVNQGKVIMAINGENQVALKNY